MDKRTVDLPVQSTLPLQIVATKTTNSRLTNNVAYNPILDIIFALSLLSFSLEPHQLTKSSRFHNSGKVILYREIYCRTE
ncbi:unnamed protein product [Rhizophagus irregularis]|nr:unnamed protein product [Rhizophagus irregularis]CAB5317616.1 unnamed protein product [Rhizophagus irregularis]